MQRLSRMSLAPQRRALTLQIKETGTPVDFADARELNTQKYLFRNDIFGIYAYQGNPITVNAATRNNCLNGALSDLLTQAAGQGMNIKYLRISWNEVQSGSNYYITDFVVGVVAEVARDYNTGPAYLIEAMYAVSWLNGMISKMIMPWQSWLLLPATHDENYNTWYWEAVGGDWYKSAPIGSPIPDPPSIDEVKNYILSSGNVNGALGEFAKKLLDKGYTVTLLSYKLQVCYQRSVEIVDPYLYRHGYTYKTHIRLSWEFRTTPELEITPGEITARLKKRSLFAITATFIYAVILLVGGLVITGIVAYTFFNNITTETSGWRKYAVLTDAEGNPILDEEGNPIIYVEEEGWQEGPPDWWSDILLMIAAGALIIAGVAFALPPIIRALRGKK